MRKVLVATLIGLSTLALSQPVKADSNRSYRLAYQLISRSRTAYLSNEEFREYTLKWLEQDKGHPHKFAMSYCQSKRSGFSDSKINDRTMKQLLARQSREGWSESRTTAYGLIQVTGYTVGLHYYCPEFIDKDINQ